MVLFFNKIYSNALLRYEFSASGIKAYCDMNNTPIILVFLLLLQGENPLLISLISLSQYTYLSSPYVTDTSDPYPESTMKPIYQTKVIPNNIYYKKSIPPQVIYNDGEKDFRERASSFNSTKVNYYTDSEELPPPQPNPVIHSQPVSSINSPVYPFSKHYRNSSAHLVPPIMQSPSIPPPYPVSYDYTSGNRYLVSSSPIPVMRPVVPHYPMYANPQPYHSQYSNNSPVYIESPQVYFI